MNWVLNKPTFYLAFFLTLALSPRLPTSPLPYLWFCCFAYLVFGFLFYFTQREENQKNSWWIDTENLNEVILFYIFQYGILGILFRYINFLLRKMYVVMASNLRFTFEMDVKATCQSITMGEFFGMFWSYYRYIFRVCVCVIEKAETLGGSKVEIV